MPGLFQHCIELSRPVLRLIPLSFKTAIKKAIRYNINTQDYWNTIWEREGTDTWRDYVNKYPFIISQIPDEGRLIDIGCGVGKLLSKLREQKPKLELTGLDISAVAIELLEKQGFKGVVGSFPDLPLATSAYDIVLATEVLEHLSDPAEAVTEILRLMPSGGCAVLTVPDDCLGPEDEVQHLWKFNRETYTALLSPYFGEIEMTSIPDLNHQFLVAVCRKPNKALARGA